MSTWFLHFFLFLITTNLIQAVHSHCIEDQQLSLLHLKKSLVFDSSESSRLITWNASTDCCSWLGVTCSTNGHVVGLDLSSECISRNIDNSSSLFQLQHLLSLNLAYNDFNDSQIPSAIGKLTNLRYLNLSGASFVGEIPIEISRLTRLAILELSDNNRGLTAENLNLSMLFQNLTELTELNLEGVNLSAQGPYWCQAISSSLQNLRVLSLSDCELSGPICESFTKLQCLSEIDLSFNNFSAPVPRFFANFSKLTSLNLGGCNLQGTFPREIFHIPCLQTIDLSYNQELGVSFPEFPNNGSLQSMVLSDTKFSGILPNSIGNLKMLSEFDLSYCSFTGTIPKSIANLTKLVNLESLDLTGNLLNGSIPSSIFSLPLLKWLSLSDNLLSGQLPELSNTSSPVLSVVDLENNNLEGQIPTSIFNLQGLQYLHLSSNNFTGFPFHGPQQPRYLSSLDLSHNSLLFDYNGTSSSFLQIERLLLASNKLRAFPDFLKNQSTLSELDLSRNQIHGQIPNWIWKLSSLWILDLAYNSLSTLEAPLPNKLRAFPDFLKNQSTVLELYLSRNQIQGQIPNWIWKLSSLGILDLSYNSLSTLEAPLPNKLRAFPDFLKNQSTLSKLDLSRNQIQGHIPNWIWKLSSLEILDLSYNSLSTLEAPLPNKLRSFPDFLRNQSTLNYLDLSNNQVQGQIPNWIWKLSCLRIIDLSYNSLSTLEAPPPNKLRSLTNFLRNQSTLKKLDLSNNQIQGQLPNWIWSLNSLEILNLSCNSLESLEPPLLNSTFIMSVLDLHSNQLQGQIPMFVSGQYLDYSRNNFNSSIPTDIGDFISATTYLSLSSNNLHGAIPKSICNAIGRVLDLSNNSLSGNIPQCLTQAESLSVLALRRNNLTGTISDNFLKDCQLQTLDLSINQIQGQFLKSLVNCSRLELLNLGNNQIRDTFPCLLMSISTLRVLVLHFNKFYGSIGCPKINDTWPVLQIIDLAHNNLSGEIPGRKSLTWQAMVSNEDDSSTNLEFSYSPPGSMYNRLWSDPSVYYRDAITTIIKGLELDLVKILTVFTLIDFSYNNFNGSIPEEMGQLKSLYVLNLSGNALTGEIPSSFGTMRQLESLDLSHNHLSGQIPPQFANLTFLAFLNVSNNQLTGRIPTSTQFSTFPKTSFEGNRGLWGPPLTADTVALLPPPMLNGSLSNPNSGDEIDWDIISVEIGFICGLGIAVGSLLFCKRWRKWYYRAVCNILFKIFPLLEQRFGNQTRHVYVTTRWRH